MVIPGLEETDVPLVSLTLPEFDTRLPELQLDDSNSNSNSNSNSTLSICMYTITFHS